MSGWVEEDGVNDCRVRQMFLKKRSERSKRLAWRDEMPASANNEQSCIGLVTSTTVIIDQDDIVCYDTTIPSRLSKRRADQKCTIIGKCRSQGRPRPIGLYRLNCRSISNDVLTVTSRRLWLFASWLHEPHIVSPAMIVNREESLRSFVIIGDMSP